MGVFCDRLKLGSTVALNCRTSQKKGRYFKEEFMNVVHCTMGRGGVETKVNKGTCYWVWNLWDKILACMKKDPSCFRKHPEQCFLRPDLKFFLEFQKKFWFAISVNLKMTIQNYFFVKKVCKKKSPIKFVGNFLSRKEHIRAHPNEYEIYAGKYFLVWKKTRAATANNRNNVF